MGSPYESSPVDKDWHNCDYEIKEQDRFLPIANVGRVMKKTLPPHAKLSKEAKECIQECVSEFISFVTSQASDRCKRENRKTLNGEDVLWALYTLGFENYSEALKIYLAKYRQHEQEQAQLKPSKRKKTKARIQSGGSGGSSDGGGGGGGNDDDDEQEDENEDENDDDIDYGEDEEAFESEFEQLLYQQQPQHHQHHHHHHHQEQQDSQTTHPGSVEEQVQFHQSERGVEFVLRSSHLDQNPRFPR